MIFHLIMVYKNWAVSRWVIVKIYFIIFTFKIDQNKAFEWRPSITDLEITDDIDESNGEEISSPNIAMYTRSVPWKPSNASSRVNLTTLNSSTTQPKQL